jgi:hypothetical protein
MKVAAVLAASIVLIGTYLLVASSLGFGTAAIAIGTLVIAAAGALVAMALTPGMDGALRA